MLSVQAQTSAPQCTPNVLPCRINHNGPANASKRYWCPEDDAEGKKTAYFRGRKLHGRSVKVPEGYKGVIVQSSDRMLSTAVENKSRNTLSEQPSPQRIEDEDSADEEAEQVMVLEKIATFEELVVWGHENVPKKDDVFVRTMEEWIGFAEAMHSTASPRPSGIAADSKP